VIFWDLLPRQLLLVFVIILYYIIFVDDYSRYTWLYPMKAKSDSVDCFKHFKSMGETLFQGIIIA
jgi:hypothetical protein